jgi:hypothetical protein
MVVALGAQFEVGYATLQDRIDCTSDFVRGGALGKLRAALGALAAIESAKGRAGTSNGGRRLIGVLAARRSQTVLLSSSP